jgi:hypothetical protein
MLLVIIILKIIYIIKVLYIIHFCVDVVFKTINFDHTLSVMYNFNPLYIYIYIIKYIETVLYSFHL